VAALLPRLGRALAGRYVVSGSQTSPALTAAGARLGLTWNFADLVVRPFVLRWRGRRPALVLNDTVLSREAEDLVAGGAFDSPDEARLWAFGRVAVHEAGHILTLSPPYYGGQLPRRGPAAVPP